MPYLRPSVSIQQEFALLPTSIAQSLNAVLVGPRKKIADYNKATDLSQLAYGLYENIDGVSQEFRGLPIESKLYPESVKLNLQEVLAKYATLSGSNVIKKSSTVASQISLGSNPSASGSFKGVDRNAVFQNRDVQIGDRVTISVDGSPVITTRVTDYVADTVPASFDEEFTQSLSNNAPQSYTDSDMVLSDVGEGRLVAADTSAGIYSGDLAKGITGDIYSITCVSGGSPANAVWNVTSVNGDNVSNVRLPAPGSGTPFVVGTNGLYAIVDGGNETYVTGESYQISVTAAFDQVTPEIVSSVYEGSVDTTYIVSVVKGGTWSQNPMVAVTTTNGIDYSPATIVSGPLSVISLGALGASFRFSSGPFYAQNGLRAGDSYVISVTAKTSGAIRGLALASPIPSSVAPGSDISVDFMIYKKEIAVPVSGYPSYGSEALTIGEDNRSFTVSALEILDTSWTASGTTTQLPLDVVSAQVYVSFTALLTDNINVYNDISNLSEITSNIGHISEDNELAYAALLALENSGGQTVYWVGVGEDSLEGYLAALEALEGAQSAYFVVPLSDRLDIQQAFKGHVEEMSLPTYGLERIALVSTPVSQTIDIVSKKQDGSFWSGYVSADANIPSLFNRVTIPGASLLDDGVRAGDIFRTNYSFNSDGTQSFQSALVSSVIDNENLILANPAFSSGVASEEVPARIDISRLLTKSEYASQIAAVSSSFGSRRVYNVWPSHAVNASGVTVPGYMVAAAVAGLKSSVAPQQGITNYTLNGFSSLKLSGQFFTPTQLDTIAGGGTLIVNQDVNGGEVYVRHQISTDQVDANHSELSITTNLDSISKYIRPQLKSLIGVYNITPSFLLSARALLMRNLDYLTAYTSTPTAGPQVISYNVNDIVVVQDPLLATRVIATAPITLPYPLNNFDLTLIVV
jgi:hypothetical protein